MIKFKDILNDFEYIGFEKQPYTLWQDYDSYYLTEDNPKQDNPQYKIDVDYKLVVKRGTKLHLFYSKINNTLYFINHSGYVVMYYPDIENFVIPDLPKTLTNYYIDKWSKSLYDDYIKITEEETK